VCIRMCLCDFMCLGMCVGLCVRACVRTCTRVRTSVSLRAHARAFVCVNVPSHFPLPQHASSSATESETFVADPQFLTAIPPSTPD